MSKFLSSWLNWNPQTPIDPGDKSDKTISDTLAHEGLKQKFNQKLSEYRKIESKINSLPTKNLRNHTFHQLESEWGKLFKELNELQFLLGDENYSPENGYEV